MKPGSVVAERFVIEATAGSGGMGVVYRVRDVTTGGLVALKLLHGRPREGDVEAARFDREALLLAELRHPAIVHYVAHGRTESGQPFLAMEWLEGESLAARLKRAPLPIAEAVDLARRVAEALGEAHRRGIVHRDIKPGNLHLQGDCIEGVKVLDFGIARVRGEGASLTATGAMIGTPGYMAPEQARGDRGVDASADVFSLGCVLFRCIAGRPPFEGDDVMAVLLKLVLEDAPRLADLCEVPAPLGELVERMLSKEASRRPADGHEVARALEALGPLVQSAGIASARGAAGGDDDEGPTTTQGPLSLTTGERRVVCLVLARAPALSDEDADALPTRAGVPQLRDALARLGARLDTLADGTLLVMVSTTGAATDQAVRAARAALAMASFLPGASIALVTGRATTDGRGVTGAVVERGVRLVADGGRSVRIDSDSAALVERTFQIERNDDAFHLVAEHDVGASVRHLLGRPTPCVGRERELGTLEAIYEEAVSESSARAAIVTGAPGVGKSRVRAELLRRLHEHDPRPDVWIARADSMASGSPFGLLGPMLRRVFGVLDGEPAKTSQARIKARVVARVARSDAERVARFLGELAAVPFPDDDFPQLASARHEPRLMGDQMRNAFEDWVRAECVSPVVMVLEDLHWGDLPSMSFVDTVLARIDDRPLFVLGLARPSVHEVFPNLWGDRGAQEVRLGPLPKRASEELARAVFADRADPDAIARAVDLAAGNAFYLEELLRAVADGVRELPSTVLAMVESRIEGLDPDMRRALRAASVFGSAAWPSAVAALLGSDDAAAATGPLAELARREFLTARRQSRFPGQDEYTFRHALLRDAAYATLTDEDRTLGHRIAAAWLERSGEQDAASLADHYERGGDRAKALAHYTRAAEKALEGSDLKSTGALVDRAMATGGAEGETRGRLLALKANASAWRGELDRAETAGREALLLLRPGSAPWYAAVGAIIIGTGLRGKTEELRAVVAPMRDVEPDDDALELEASALVTGAVRLLLAGMREAAEAAYEQLAAANQRSDNPMLGAGYAVALGARLMVQGDAYGSLRQTALAEQVLLEHGHRRFAVTARTQRGIALNELGAFEEADRAFAQAADDLERIAMYSFLPVVQHNWGLSLLRLGRVDEAILAEKKALVRCADIQPLLAASCHKYLAKIFLAKGELDQALHHAHLSTTPTSPRRAAFAHALATRAFVELARGEHDAAVESAGRGRSLLDEIGTMDEGESVVRLAWIEALRAAGRDAEARVAIAQARDRLFERAVEILEPAYAKTFFEDVPENVRIFELSRALVAVET